VSNSTGLDKFISNMLSESPEQFLLLVQKTYGSELFVKFRVFRELMENPFQGDGSLMLGLAKSLQPSIAITLNMFYDQLLNNLGNYQNTPLLYQAFVLFTEKIPTALEEFVKHLSKLLASNRTDRQVVETLSVFKGKV
jgi:hypothetical protein